MKRDAPPPAPTVSVPVIEEQLEVGHRLTDTGAALRVRKEVDHTVSTVRQPVVSESAVVERVRIGRVVDATPAVRHEGDVIVVPVVEERLVTRTELVLVEEIRVTRRRETQQADTEVALRRERVIVERFDPDTQQWRVVDNDNGA